MIFDMTAEVILTLSCSDMFSVRRTVFVYLEERDYDFDLLTRF